MKICSGCIVMASGYLTAVLIASGKPVIRPRSFIVLFAVLFINMMFSSIAEVKQ